MLFRSNLLCLYHFTATTGEISPSSSFRDPAYSRGTPRSLFRYAANRSSPPPHMLNSHCWRYRDKNCCHPKNVGHCLCYRETRWNGRVERPVHKWYDCRGTGPVLCLLLILMWSVAWPYVGCGLCCFLICCLCLGGFDSSWAYMRFYYCHIDMSVSFFNIIIIIIIIIIINSREKLDECEVQWI